MAYGDRVRSILILCRRPRTNAEIAEVVCDHSAGVARDMSRLQHQGRVINLNPGRGQIAIYQTVEGAR